MSHLLRNVLLSASALLLATAPAAASSLIIDFEGFGHGEIVAADNGGTSHPGYHVRAKNHNRSFDIGVAFDTGRSGTRDRDLEMGPGWALGNLAPGTDLGNILILQENDKCKNGFCKYPDDEGGRPAGYFAFMLDRVYETFRFDLIDVESATLEAGSVSFGLGTTPVASFTFADLLGLGQGVVFGDNSANRIDLGAIGAFDNFEINMGGSGGVDNIVLGHIVPEPGTAALLSLGLLGLAFAGRRQR